MPLKELPFGTAAYQFRRINLTSPLKYLAMNNEQGCRTKHLRAAMLVNT